MAATLKLRILAAAATIAVVATSSEAPAPGPAGPSSGTAATAPAFAVGTFAVAAVGYLFCWGACVTSLHAGAGDQLRGLPTRSKHAPGRSFLLVAICFSLVLLSDALWTIDRCIFRLRICVFLWFCSRQTFICSYMCSTDYNTDMKWALGTYIILPVFFRTTTGDWTGYMKDIETTCAIKSQKNPV
jgi:hypothetical protein